ncbi:MAG TPA: RluA family pseudouridine synthase [Geminicoccaceae bacterium]|nr:RluA family pseudouridine synthase [Geminicoccaceae bacterium]
MSGVELRAVAADEAELRLDRWFRRHFPELGHGRLQKLLRTGQVRIDGRRADAGARLRSGQSIRIPPLGKPAGGRAPRRSPAVIESGDADWLRSRILHEDEALLVLDKPAGLAVQGGTKTKRHVDGMLAALARDDERPRLVHRLDRDTSGLLVVAKSARVAAKLTEAFRQHRVGKLYWALVVGRPPLAAGLIDRPLAKQAGGRGERIEGAAGGLPAQTRYRTVARAGKVASWLALQPLTGRTHQLRAHCALIGTPILGDRKYGGAAAVPAGAPGGLMLHAREIRLPHPDGRVLALTAPLGEVVRNGFAWLGFEPDPDLPGATLADFDPA